MQTQDPSPPQRPQLDLFGDIEDRRDVASLVHIDIEARISEGAREYGERLTTRNGRDSLWDAYEEALDLALYLRQAIEEQRH